MFKRITQKYLNGLESQLYQSDIGGIENPYETREDRILTGLSKVGNLAYPYSAIDKALNYSKELARKAILTGLIVGMCYGSSWSQSSEESDYFPLQIGNRWVYEWTVNGKASGPTEERILSVRDTTRINGQTYFVLTGTGFILNYLAGGGFRPPYNEALPVRKDSSNRVLLWASGKIQGIDLHEAGDRLWYDFNFKRHVITSWSMHYPMRFSTHYEMWPEKLSSVNTPAGTFHDVIMLWMATPSVMDDWEPMQYFAPDVGLVRMDMIPYFENKQIQLFLKEAIVNGVRYPQESTLTKSGTWGRIKSTFVR